MSQHPALQFLRLSEKGKVVSAAEAVRLIRDGDTVATGGFVGIGFAEEIALALEALEFAQFEAAGWREMLNDALRQTGGPLTEGERKWADELLRPPGSNAV